MNQYEYRVLSAFGSVKAMNSLDVRVLEENMNSLGADGFSVTKTETLVHGGSPEGKGADAFGLFVVMERKSPN